MSNNRIPIKEREKDLNALNTLILTLEHSADTKTLTVSSLNLYKQAVVNLTDKYAKDPSFRRGHRGLFKPFELNALIHLAQGDEAMADSLLRDAITFMKSDEEWVSNTAKKWDANHRDHTVLNTSQNEQVSELSSNMVGIFALSVVLGILTLILDIFINLPKLNQVLNNLPAVGNDLSNSLHSFKTGIIFYDIASIILLGVIGYMLVERKRVIRPISILTMLFIIVGYAWITSDLESAFRQAGSDTQFNQAPWIVMGAFFWLPFWIFTKKTKAQFTN